MFKFLEEKLVKETCNLQTFSKTLRLLVIIQCYICCYNIDFCLIVIVINPFRSTSRTKYYQMYNKNVG